MAGATRVWALSSQSSPALTCGRSMRRGFISVSLSHARPADLQDGGGTRTGCCSSPEAESGALGRDENQSCARSLMRGTHRGAFETSVTHRKLGLINVFVKDGVMMPLAVVATGGGNSRLGTRTTLKSSRLFTSCQRPQSPAAVASGQFLNLPGSAALPGTRLGRSPALHRRESAASPSLMGVY